MNKSDLKRDYFMLKGPLAKKGYDKDMIGGGILLLHIIRKLVNQDHFSLNILYVIRHWLRRNLL